MRDIEFRAWSKRLGKYLEQSKVIIEGTGTVFVDDSFGTDVKPKKLIIEQYTGLHDKNGKKIFEGDILKSSVGHTQPFYYLVEYLEEYAAFVVDHLFLGGVSGVNLKPYEVVGNIHENSNLLGETI